MSRAPSPRWSAREGYHQFTDGGGSLEVFWHDESEGGPEDLFAGPGWYWWACWPGCLPDGDPTGPFASSTAAWRDARDE